MALQPDSYGRVVDQYQRVTRNDIREIGTNLGRVEVEIDDVGQFPGGRVLGRYLLGVPPRVVVVAAGVGAVFVAARGRCLGIRVRDVARCTAGQERGEQEK